MAMIEFKNVSFTYIEDGENAEKSQKEQQKAAVNGLNFEISAGEFVAVLGHNGSGKSTAAKLMNAILVPQSGEVLVSGINTADESRVFEIRQNVGMVFQNPDNQIVASIVEEDVAFGPENLGLDPAEIRQRVDFALETVGMLDEKLSAPHKLSGGQKQRVAVAGIIAMKPKCIVLDEPTAMLDPIGRQEVMATIKQLNRDEGITIVLITHFMDEAVQANRVIVMDDGEILLDDKPQNVFSQVPLLKSVGLDVPQAAELAYAIDESADGILDVEQCVDYLTALLGGTTLGNTRN